MSVATEQKLVEKQVKNNLCMFLFFCVYPQVACRAVLIWLYKMGLDQSVCISQESHKHTLTDPLVLKVKT